MKRDVKVGLLVAAVVCGLAAILLGGGLVARPVGSPSALRVSEEEPPPSELAAEPSSGRLPDGSPAGALPEGLAEGVLPPAEGAAELPAQAPPALSLAPSDLAGEAPRLVPPGTAISEKPDDWREAAPAAGRPARADIVGTGEASSLSLVEPAQELAESATAGSAPPVAPPAAVVPVPPPARHVYVVQEGESFYTISKKLFGTVRYFPDIQKANPDIDPKKLRPGMRIAIPEIPGAGLRKELLAAPEEPKPRSRIILAQDKMHLVQPGEVLEDISLKYYGTKHKWQHILRANPDIADPKALKPGREIVVPALTE